MTDKSAVIAVVGRPNVGKSTLVNTLVGEKVAIVTNKPQTTRGRIRGIARHGEVEFVLVDTPGFHRARNKLGEQMVRTSRESVNEVDAAVLVVEPIANVGGAEQGLIDGIRSAGVPAVLVVNKIDTITKEELLPVIAMYSDAYEFAAIVPISARRGEGVPELLKELAKFAVDSPPLFTEDMTSDQPDAVVCAEIVREKLLLCLEREVPHGVAIEVMKFSERDNGIIDLEVTIHCEKNSHKGIIIGKNGTMLKKIGEMARIEIEKYMGTKVFLQTWVKVRDNWRDNDSALRSFGFDNR